MWVTKSIPNNYTYAQDLDSDFDKTLSFIVYVLNISAMVVCPLITILSISIIPAVFEDIKDNIFLLLGGNRNLWDNFYQLTLTMSSMKLDIMANFEFWTGLFFIQWNIDYDNSQYSYIVYWSIFGGLLFIVILVDLVGFKQVSEKKSCKFDNFNLD